ncbi:MAG: T9SS type A sorting domain-containing protein [Flavobacteriaceae bacterium]
MKTIVAFLALFLSVFTFSQEYIPMLQEGNSWSIQEIAFPGVPQVFYRIDEITGTEVINNKLYYIMNGIPDCRYREENGILYGYSISGNNEIELYNFNLEVGDEITFPFEPPQNYCDNRGQLYEGETMIVTSRTEEFIADQNRIVLEFELFGEVIETWIEGVGSLRGFYPNQFRHIDTEILLTCFVTNGATYYFNDFTFCENLATQDFSISNIKLYPNPVIQTSTLQFPEEANIDALKIYDVSGRLILEDIITEDFYTIDAMNYDSGLYFYQVFSERELLKSDAFIVK